MENIIANLVALALDKRSLWSKLDEDGHQALGHDYWCEYHGVLDSLMIVTGKSYSEVMDMVYDAA